MKIFNIYSNLYLPSCLRNNHFCANTVEFTPKISVLQGDFNVFIHGITLSRAQHPLVVRMGGQGGISSELLALTLNYKQTQKLYRVIN